MQASKSSARAHVEIVVNMDISKKDDCPDKETGRVALTGEQKGQKWVHLKANIGVVVNKAIKKRITRKERKVKPVPRKEQLWLH